MDATPNTKQGRKIFGIGEFIEKNYKLFTVIGVFIAFSVYLLRLPEDVVEGRVFQVRMATAIGFILSIMISGVILTRSVMWIRTGTEDWVRTITYYRNLPLILFLILFYLMLSGIYVLVLAHQTIVGAIFRLLFLFAGASSVMIIFRVIDNIREPLESVRISYFYLIPLVLSSILIYIYNNVSGYAGLDFNDAMSVPNEIGWERTVISLILVFLFGLAIMSFLTALITLAGIFLRKLGN